MVLVKMEPSEDRLKEMEEEAFQHSLSNWLFINSEDWRKHQDLKIGEVEEHLIKCEKSIGMLLLERAQLLRQLQKKDLAIINLNQELVRLKEVKQVFKFSFFIFYFYFLFLFFICEFGGLLFLLFLCFY